ncbi:MAG: 4-(cytidine 5'-diphospho)-2-C-methyl-D-erythritol kinase, partial [Dehalococcoidia bacterium]
LWGLALSLDELLPLAAELGADVPFFLRGGTALAQGRGEEITPLPPLPETWLVLLRPPLDVGVPGKTARLYTLLSPANYSDGGATRRLVEHLKGGSLSPNLLMNAFEAVVDLAFPSLQGYRTLLHQAGAAEVHLTGTGPALYALVARREDGERMVQQLRSWGQEAYLVCTVPPYEG